MSEFNELFISYCDEVKEIAPQVIAETRSLCGEDYDLSDYTTEECVTILEQNIEWVSRSKRNWRLLSTIISDVDFNHNHYASILMSDLKRYRSMLQLTDIHFVKLP
jgi:hypothetical protein